MADIRIKDLNLFTGEPSASDFLAIDSEGETRKAPANIYALDSKTKLNVTRLGSNRDLDDLWGIEKSGFYYITEGVAHAPTTYCALIVISQERQQDHGTTFQLAFRNTGIYWRSYSGDPLTWGAWRMVQGSEIV